MNNKPWTATIGLTGALAAAACAPNAKPDEATLLSQRVERLLMAEAGSDDSVDPAVFATEKKSLARVLAAQPEEIRKAVADHVTTLRSHILKDPEAALKFCNFSDGDVREVMLAGIADGDDRAALVINEKRAKELKIIDDTLPKIGLTADAVFVPPPILLAPEEQKTVNGLVQKLLPAIREYSKAVEENVASAESFTGSQRSAAGFEHKQAQKTFDEARQTFHAKLGEINDAHRRATIREATLNECGKAMLYNPNDVSAPHHYGNTKALTQLGFAPEQPTRSR